MDSLTKIDVTSGLLDALEDAKSRGVFEDYSISNEGVIIQKSGMRAVVYHPDNFTFSWNAWKTAIDSLSPKDRDRAGWDLVLHGSLFLRVKHCDGEVKAELLPANRVMVLPEGCEVDQP